MDTISKIIHTRIKHKKDTDISFSQRNPVLLDGEIVVVDTGSTGIKIKIGNGVLPYNDLPFFGTIYSEKPEYSVDEIVGLNSVLERYNNTISQLEQLINDYNTTIEGMQEIVNDVNTNIPILDNKITSLNTQVDLIPVLPIGIIMIWSGSEDAIPNGWSLCNGSNGTPDLTDKFILGAGAKYGVGSLGGEETVILTVDHLPSHSHEFTRHKATSEETGNGDSGYGASNKTLDMITTSTASVGGDKAHNNMPPYYALCYIMHIG